MLNILVAGAGIGGLSAALALERAGHRVTVAERTESSNPAGAGLLLQPGAVRDLGVLGVEVDTFAYALRTLRIIGPKGRSLGAAPRPRGGRPRLGCTRAHLSAALRRAGEDRLDVLWGAEISGLEERPGVVECSLGGAAASFDLVVGADGLRSSIRRQIGLDVRLRYSGLTCWRALVDVECGPDGVESWQGAERWGVIPVGSCRSYVYGTLVAAVGTTSEVWPAGRFLPDSDDSFGAALQAAACLPAGRVLHHDLFELERTAWGTERVILLGDAAHAMTPNLGEGAAAAIADARALAMALESGLDGAAARYRALRRARVGRARIASRMVGRVARLAGGLLR